MKRASGVFTDSVRLAFGIGAAVALVATLAIAQDRPSHRQSRARIVRVHRWTTLPSATALPLPLPGRVTGVLFRARLTAWGGAPEQGAGVAASYVLSIDGSMPYWVYFPSDGRGEDVQQPYRASLPDGASYEFPQAALFVPDTPNPFGLHADLHVVELEVNGGAGSREAHFVATNVRVLDGTPEFPMRVDDVLRAVQARIDRAVAGARGPIARVRRHGTVVTDIPSVRATWRTSDRTLETTFTFELTSERRGAEILRRTDTCPPCPCAGPRNCAPCARCLPDTHEYVRVDTLELGMGRVDVLAADGRVLRETFLVPHVARTSGTVDVNVIRELP